ncbi:MAG: O-antigen ligase family protein [Ardenticatenaceae bacterium]|nr:O-antigen ligase family protein [Anaerolineales bacterium]MCB8940811.1 O-antigen ligase family protein [Ardenticatenaceae bacterium]MCB8972150.1 O-antigen ligase family protein [Ardenticatenaceae bacterium]
MTSLIQKTFRSTEGRRWLQLLVMIGVLFVSIVIARTGPQISMLVVIAALPILVVGGYLLVRYPPLGFLLIIVISTVVKFDLPPIGLIATLILLLTGLWVVDMVVRQREISLVKSPTMAPLVMFTAVVILSFIVGQLPWFSIAQVPIDNQVGGIAIFILSFAAFILVAHQVRDIRWIKWMVFLFLGLAGPAVFIGMRFLPGWRQLNQLLLHPKTTGGSLFWLWLASMTFSQVLFNKKLDVKWRGLLLAVLVGYLYLALGRNRAWTSGWAPTFVALFVILWVARPKWAMPMTMVGVAGLIVLFQPIYNAVFIGDNEYSAVTRLEAWRIVGQIVKVNPILGLGPGNYYNYTLLYPILGWYVEFNSHNNYVDIVAQTGILGLICFIWFVAVTWKLGWRLRNQVPKDGFTQAFVYGALGGLAGSVAAGMLGDWVLPFVYNIGIFGFRSSIYAWLFLGGLVAIDQIRLAGASLE